VKFGLGVNANETTAEIVTKSVLAEKLGLDYVWVSDVPVQLYAPAVASAIAEKTKNIQIGLGLMSVFLHTPLQIANSLVTLLEAYGERFELCIGPGDKNLLKSVGLSLSHQTGIANYLLDSKKQIEKTLRRNNQKCRIWLGAQGPKVLEKSRFFDGVLLNYAQPDLINWAVSVIGPPKRKDFQYGIFSSSYVYSSFDPEIYNLLRISSTIVALGASKSVLKTLGLTEEIATARKKMDEGKPFARAMDLVPVTTVELFSILKSSSELADYLSKISETKISHVVFSYPQNYSKKTIQELAQALKVSRNEC
jgi:hypothetical protein